MPPAAPDATQPLETTRRTTLATAESACAAVACTSRLEDETWLDAAQIKLNDAAKARDERFARVMGCVDIKLCSGVSATAESWPPQVMSGGMRDYEGWER